MKKLWLNIKAVNIVIIAIALYALILSVAFVSDILGALKKLVKSKDNGKEPSTTAL